MQIKTVGVIGCGLMGAGIAQVCAQAGFETYVREVAQDALDNGMSRIEKLLTKDVTKAKISEADKAATLARLHPTTELSTLAACDLIIEAIVENIEAKRDVFQQLDSICPETTIFVSNTSSLTIVEMAATTKRADRFAGLHFFNPVPVMKLVEIIQAITTTDETVATLKSFVTDLGKTPIETQDTTGFIVNRLLIPYLLDAVRVYESGVASREDIDTGMKLGCGHPMGPLELLDFVGIDTTYYIANIMFDEFREPRFAPPALLRRMVLAGQLGRKSGKGFYDYK